MSNFKLEFTYPWLLLLLIPALALALLPYFRMRKQYRRNRNRVISVAMHVIVCLCCVLLLSGMTISFDKVNKENEIILLVDSSFSGEGAEERREGFIQQVVNDCGDDYKLGIVKFGFDQVYAAEVSDDARRAYQNYLASPDPDTTATDIAAALKYASTLFTNTKAAKIVVLSDGLETDESALSVIKSIAAQGIKVDVADMSSEKSPEVQIVGVEAPDYNVVAGEEFSLKLTLQSDLEGVDNKVSVTLSDNGEDLDPLEFTLISGTQIAEITHSFEEEGLHQLKFTISAEGDSLTENDAYYTYIDMLKFDKILMIEKDEGEGDALKAALEKGEYEVESLSVQSDLTQFPKDLETLCLYDQVLLVNVANKDMPAGFDELLYSYVYDLGGGLFTVGGNNDRNDEGDPVPHAYNRDDMYGTLYQQMLPVQVIEYTPPVAVMIVIDCSGSMGSGDDNNLVRAKQGALTCLDVLSSRDFCGIITFDSSSSEDLQLTQVSQRDKIREKILSIPDKGEGSTIFSDAIRRAGAALSATDVDKKHIILVTDGQPGDAPEDYNEFIDANLQDGITMSIVTAGVYGDYEVWMDEAAERAGGKHYNTNGMSSEALASSIRTDLMENAVSEIKYGEPFTMKINRITPTVAGIDQTMLDNLPFTGYYGTRAKDGAEVPLIGDFVVPMYAQWRFGEGRVGSFMSSLNGDWSGGFLDDENGLKLLYNMVNGIFPTSVVEVSDIRLTLKEDNYSNTLNVYTQKADDDIVTVTVTPLTRSAEAFYANNPIQAVASDAYTRFTFTITQPGVYLITAEKRNAAGEVLSSETMYKSFSYSGEYNVFPDTSVLGEPLLKTLAADGNGVVISDSLEIFASFEKTLHKVVDPRLALLITAIVCFLLDIAVRKFKFKWPHEIIRDRRAKKELSEGKQGK